MPSQGPPQTRLGDTGNHLLGGSHWAAGGHVPDVVSALMLVDAQPGTLGPCPDAGNSSDATCSYRSTHMWQGRASVPSNTHVPHLYLGHPFSELAACPWRCSSLGLGGGRGGHPAVASLCLPLPFPISRSCLILQSWSAMAIVRAGGFWLGVAGERGRRGVYLWLFIWKSYSLPPQGQLLAARNPSARDSQSQRRLPVS